MGTLYVVGAPAGGAADFTLRARRILGSVALVAAADGAEARRSLDDCEISTPVAPAADPDRLLRALTDGDVALLVPGRSLAPGAEEQSLVSEALMGGFAVVPVPGPTMPVSALVLSGLPADGFVYLGDLPADAGERHALLASVADEARTLVLLSGAGELPALLSLVSVSWGDRPLALWPASPGSHGQAWQGSLAEALAAGEALSSGQAWVLVAGGAPQAGEGPWGEDRLRAAIRASLERGLGVGQISRELAAASGWARRDIYRLALREDHRRRE